MSADNIVFDLDYSGYHKKPNLKIVLLYTERKNMEVIFCFFTDGKQHESAI